MKITTFLPTHDNQGRAFGRKKLNAIIEEAWRQFGGYTLSGPQQGGWLDSKSKKLHQDRSCRLEIVTERAQLEESRDWVVSVGRRLDQLAMYFEVRDYDGVQILDVT